MFKNLYLQQKCGGADDKVDKNLKEDVMVDVILMFPRKQLTLKLSNSFDVFKTTVREAFDILDGEISLIFNGILVTETNFYYLYGRGMLNYSMLRLIYRIPCVIECPICTAHTTLKTKDEKYRKCEACSMTLLTIDPTTFKKCEFHPKPFWYQTDECCKCKECFKDIRSNTRR